MATLRHLDNRDIPHCGTGQNLESASAPAYLNVQGKRMAFLGVTSSFHDSYLAGPEGARVIGRPGVAPLRHNCIYKIPSSDFDTLHKILSFSGVNSYHAQAIKEGYLPQSNNMKIGYYEFSRSEDLGYYSESHPHRSDLERTISQIRESRYYADFIIVSVHGHQFKPNGTKEDVPQFAREFAQKCIDAGANVVACHGPHIVRGIEIYNKGVIFHGLGNFICQHDMPLVAPMEAYEKSNVSPCEMGPAELYMDKKSCGGTKGIINDDKSWQSIIAEVKYTSGEYEIILHPIELMRYSWKGLKGLPKLTSDTTVLQRIKDLSYQYGTSMEIKNGMGYIRVKNIRN